MEEPLSVWKKNWVYGQINLWTKKERKVGQLSKQLIMINMIILTQWLMKNPPAKWYFGQVIVKIGKRNGHVDDWKMKQTKWNIMFMNNDEYHINIEHR